MRIPIFLTSEASKIETTSNAFQNYWPDHKYRDHWQGNSRTQAALENGKGRWRKLKGIAGIEFSDGTICQAEISLV
jgi:hypothetical protein